MAKTMTVVDDVAALFDAAGVDGFFHARDIDTDAEVGHQADEPVVAASVFKVPVLVELFRQGDAGAIDLTEPVTVPVAGRAPGPTGMSVLLDPVTLSWRDLATWMIVVSDNAATDVICEKVGLDNVNATMAALGLQGTYLESDCRGIFATMLADAAVDSLDAFPPATDELVATLRALQPMATNRTTPRDMTRLLQLIWTDEAASPDSCAAMRAILLHQVWPHRLSSGFPEDGVVTGGKTGTLPTIRNEAGVALYPDGRRFAVATFTRSRALTGKNPAADAVIGAAARRAVDHLRGDG